MNGEMVKERTVALFQRGFHCAEAVSAAVVAVAGSGEEVFSPAVATCFGAGVGRTHEDLCGALTGGLVALGALHGRNTPGQSWQKVAALAAEYRLRFQERFGDTRCPALLERFGDAAATSCVALSGDAAALLVDLLAAHRQAWATPQDHDMARAGQGASDDQG